MELDLVSYDVSSFLSRLDAEAVSSNLRFNGYIGQPTSEVQFPYIPAWKVLPEGI